MSTVPATEQVADGVALVDGAGPEHRGRARERPREVLALLRPQLGAGAIGEPAAQVISVAGVEIAVRAKRAPRLDV